MRTITVSENGRYSIYSIEYDEILGNYYNLLVAGLASEKEVDKIILELSKN